ncbi:MAG: alpha amylase N-terminal ig-like domain-containing protein, partial [Anaerolineae bacterium]|nr:alpha amylase N-terminal ig-like domain-containing protein [Anaerolineae bacterium]
MAGLQIGGGHAMTPNPIQENKYYDGQVGFLYPYDIRHDAGDKAFCNPRPGGRVQLRLHTEHGFKEATLVYNDGQPQGAPMRLYARDSRFLYWETTLAPARLSLTYSFALKTDDNRIVYYCRHGVDHAVEPLDRWTLRLDEVSPIEPPDWMRGA